MKLILNNSVLVFNSVSETYSLIGPSDSTLEAYTSKYNSDTTARGVYFDGYTSRKTYGLRFYARAAGTVNIYVGLGGSVPTLNQTVTSVVGWNVVMFDTPLDAGYYVLLNGAGIAYSTSSPSSDYTTYGLSCSAVTSGTNSIVVQTSSSTNAFTYPAIQLYMQDE